MNQRYCFCPHDPNFSKTRKPPKSMRYRLRAVRSAHLIRNTHRGEEFGHIGCGEHEKCDPRYQDFSKYIVPDMREYIDETNELLTEPFAGLPQDILNVIFGYYSQLRPWRLALLCKKYITFSSIHIPNCDYNYHFITSDYRVPLNDTPHFYKKLIEIANLGGNQKMAEKLAIMPKCINTLYKLYQISSRSVRLLLLRKFMHKMTENPLAHNTKFKSTISVNDIYEIDNLAVKMKDHNRLYIDIYVKDDGGKFSLVSNRYNDRAIDIFARQLEIEKNLVVHIEIGNHTITISQ